MKAVTAMSKEERRHAYLTLERYHEWSASLARQFDVRMAAHQQDPPPAPGLPESVFEDAAITGYWLASLVPIVEGWEHLRLRDERIDGFLYVDTIPPDRARQKSAHFRALQRFRNGMFHYQSTWDDPRFLDLMSDKEALTWAIRLSREFASFFKYNKALPIPVVNWMIGSDAV